MTEPDEGFRHVAVFFSKMIPYRSSGLTRTVCFIKNEYKDSGKMAGLKIRFIYFLYLFNQNSFKMRK